MMMTMMMMTMMMMMMMMMMVMTMMTMMMMIPGATYLSQNIKQINYLTGAIY